MSGIIGGAIDFNNKGISKNLKDSMMETINLYNEIKKLVELRVNELNIESIVTIFNSLDSDKKI